MRTVDIIVPIHNQEQLIRETIFSVQRQTYPHWQLILVDDGSTDRSMEVLLKFSEIDERILITRKGASSVGAAHARNLGFSFGCSQYVLFLDSDDLLAETCLEHRVAALNENPDLDFVLGNTLLFKSMPYDLHVIWNTPSLRAETDLLRFLRQDMPWNTMSPLWRRESFKRLGGWNEALEAFQDWELHIRACQANFSYLLAWPLPDSFYRIPSQDRSSIASAYMAQSKIGARRSAIQSVARLDGFLDSTIRRDHVEAFCLRNALQLLDAGKNREAFNFLSNCIRGRLFRPIQAMGALGIVSRGRNWRGSRPARYIQNWLWPRDSRIDPLEEVQCAA